MNGLRFTGKEADVLILEGIEKIRKQLPTIDTLAKNAACGKKDYCIYNLTCTPEIAICILKKMLNPGISVKRGSYKDTIVIEWKYEDWLSYPNFTNIALKEIYELCVLHMKAGFEKGNTVMDLSFLFISKLYGVDILNRLQQIFQEDGFTMSFTEVDCDYKVFVSRQLPAEFECFLPVVVQ